jgi:hypothetical protein
MPTVTKSVTSYLELIGKCPSQERGHALLPDLEILNLRDRFHRESFSGQQLSLNFDQLGVGKAGMPPVFFSGDSISQVDSRRPSILKFLQLLLGLTILRRLAS